MKTAKQSIDLEYKGTKKRLNLRTALISLCMFAFVGTSAQTGTVTVKLRNASVKELFSAIEKQTSYRFSYRDAEIKGKGNVTISATNRELKQLLEGELSKLGLKYAVSGNKIIVTPAAVAPSAQPKKVTGKVVDANGEPVIGATVKEQGTANGTITDFDGNFALAVADNAMLEVSYIGYKSQELKAVAGKILSVTLREDTEVVDEVVVGGYGTQKKVNLTGAVSSISSKDITESHASSTSTLLAGRLSGVITTNANGIPGQGSSVSIRGKSSWNDAPVLYVVDGIQVDKSAFDAINVDEIENISVLKDASAAVYGSRAANGVILVTTKRGEDGKPKFSFSSNWGISSPTAMPELLNAYEYATLWNEAQTNMGYDINNPSDESLFYNEEQLDAAKKNSSDWFGETFKKYSLNQKYNISINGGNDRIKYFMSLGYLNDDGM